VTFEQIHGRFSGQKAWRLLPGRSSRVFSVRQRLEFLTRDEAEGAIMDFRVRFHDQPEFDQVRLQLQIELGTDKVIARYARALIRRALKPRTSGHVFDPLKKGRVFESAWLLRFSFDVTNLLLAREDRVPERIIMDVRAAISKATRARGDRSRALEVGRQLREYRALDAELERMKLP
jgi:hypothetical protein